MKDLGRRLGLTYLIITHNLNVVGYIADRIAVMYLGQIVEVGPGERVLTAPAAPLHRGPALGALRAGPEPHAAAAPPAGRRARSRARATRRRPAASTRAARSRPTSAASEAPAARADRGRATRSPATTGSRCARRGLARRAQREPRSRRTSLRAQRHPRSLRGGAMPTVTVNDDAVDLVYDQSGAGPRHRLDRRRRRQRRALAALAARRRSTTPSATRRFANRGVGETVCRAPEPWTIADLAVDAAALIEARLRSARRRRRPLDGRADRAPAARSTGPTCCTVGVAMGCAAARLGGLARRLHAAPRSSCRRRGGRLEGRLSTLHYASMLYPAAGARRPRAVRRSSQEMLGAEFEDDNEASLIGQWQACIDFDVADDLPGCTCRRCTSSPSSRTSRRRRSTAARSPRSRRNADAALVPRHGPLLDLRPSPRDAQRRDPARSWTPV